jgi:hypothetical protein
MTAHFLSLYSSNVKQEAVPATEKCAVTFIGLKRSRETVQVSFVGRDKVYVAK